MDTKQQNALVMTGGTSSMGYNRAGNLVPMYDMRHSLLAMKALDLVWDKGQQKILMQQIVETRELILALREKGEAGDKLLQEKLEDELDSIAAELSIITGGEISLATIMHEYRIHSAPHVPYTIDGIEFSLREHYPLLKKEVFAILEQGNTPIITMGSDTLEFVGPMLAMDLARHQRLQKHTVICVSSMIPFGDDPTHCARLLQAAMELSSHKISGAFALCAKDETAEKIEVHDLLDGFIKVSGALPHAFRSREPVGLLSREGGFSRSNMGYQPHSRSMPVSDEGGLAYVAPPLVLGKSLLPAIRYMEALPNAHVVLEAMERIAFSREEQQYLFALVRERVNRGIATIITDPLVYDHENDRIMVDNDLWRESAFVKAFARVGGVVRFGQHVSETYLEAVLSLGAVEFMEATDRLRRAYGITLQEEVPTVPTLPKDIVEEVTIHYIPDHEIFEHALKLAEKIAKKIVIEALPGGVLPARDVSVLEEILSHGHPLELHETVKVNGSKVVTGCKHREMYAASKAFMVFMEHLAAGVASGSDFASAH